MTDTTSEDEGGTIVSVTLYNDESETYVLRQIALGINPLVLLEADFDEETGDTKFIYHGSQIDSFEELLTFMEGYTEALRAAVEQNAVAGE